MVVIDMAMPKRCFECKLKLNGTCAYLIKSTGGANSKERLAECPLRSADEMIAEIEKMGTTGWLDVSTKEIIGVVHKYCDKEG